MIKRFRMIAGPNGSGKTTLVRWLSEVYAVNFYEFLNADDILSTIVRTGRYAPKFPISQTELVEYASASDYRDEVKSAFQSGQIVVEDDSVRFDPTAVNSYTVALFTNFLQAVAMRRGESFSQETVFSHPSKIDALRKAKAAGYRTYLYFVATANSAINIDRVANRKAQGGHDVPSDKIVSRYSRSVAQLKMALPYLSRAYVFDNSGVKMRFVGEYADDAGWTLKTQTECLPQWFTNVIG